MRRLLPLLLIVGVVRRAEAAEVVRQPVPDGKVEIGTPTVVEPPAGK